MSEDRELGFIVLQRKVRSSALWKSLRADQRGVFVTLLLLANWAPRKARWREAWYEVGRGELSHSLQTIAEESGCSVKVVRTTLVALMADDRPAGGNGPAVTERYPVEGTGPGTGPRILTVVNYSKYQDVTSEHGTGPGEDRARVGHGPGTERTMGTRSTNYSDGDADWIRVKRELESHVRPDAFARFFAPLTGRLEDAVLVVEAPDRFIGAFVHDNHAALLEALAGRKVEVRWPFAAVAGGAA